MVKILLLCALFVPYLFSADTLKIAVSKNVGELNPHLYSPNEMFAQNMLYESLVKFGDDSKIYPYLAKSWQISEDGKIYTFKLRDDVVFSNGEKFNARAVKINFDAILDNKKRHEWLGLINFIADTRIKSEFEFELILKGVYEPTLRELSLIRPFRFIAPSAMKDNTTKNGIKAPIGTGAFKLKESKLGIFDSFEVNEKYYAKKPKIGRIIARVIPDINTKIIALKTGEVDLIYGSEEISPEAFNMLKSEFNTAISKPLYTLSVALNSNKFPTNDKNVRKALNLAIDKDMIIKNIYFNTQPKADFLFSNADINASAYKFDLQKANEILDSAGWSLKKDKIRYKDDKALEIELVYIGNNALNKAMGEILQGMLKKIGVRLNLRADESTIFYKKQRTGEFGAIFNSTWGAPYDPQIFLSSILAPAHADYQAKFGLKDRKLIDNKIKMLLSTLEKNLKKELLDEILLKFHDEAIYLPITYETNKAVFNKRLKGVKMGIIKDDIKFENMSFE